MGQVVTGSCVNAVLAISVLLVGMSSGITIALISPVCAYLFGIAPNFVTVLPIMIGNVCFVVLLRLIAGKTQKPIWRQPVALVAAAGVKFGVLYLLAGKGNRLTWRQPVALVTAAGVKFLVLYILVVKVICGIASGALLGKKLGDTVILAPPMLKMLPTMFAWPQLFTALIGGAVALLITPVLRKALHR